MVTHADAVTLGSKVDAMVTLTGLIGGRLVGAAKLPKCIRPFVESPSSTPLTYQLTPMSDEKVLVIVELKWKAAPVGREILVGEIETVMLPGGGA